MSGKSVSRLNSALKIHSTEKGGNVKQVLIYISHLMKFQQENN